MSDLVDALHPMETSGDAVAVARQVGLKAAPFAAAHDREGSFVEEGYAAVRETGFGKLGVPLELGGGGHGLASLSEALAVLARYCANTALAIAMHQHNVLAMAWRWRLGDDEVAPVLRRVVEEGLILSSSGTLDPERSGLTATPCEGGVRVSGRKAFCSGAPGADVMIALATFADGRSWPSSVLVPLRSPGVEIVANWDAMGMRGSGSNAVALTDVFVPDANVLYRRRRVEPADEGGEATAAAPALSGDEATGVLREALARPGVHIALPMIAAVYLGVASAVYDRALRAVARSERAGSAATLRLAGMMTHECRVARWTLDSLIRETTDESLGTEWQTNRTLIAKRQIVLSSISIVELAMEMLGSMAYMRNEPYEQALRDVRAATTHPLPPEATLTFVGQAALARAASHPEPASL